MTEMQLTKEDLKTLHNSLVIDANHRKKNIKKGLVIVVVSILFMILTAIFFEKEINLIKLLSVGLIGVILGALRSIWWYRNFSNQLLETDIANGIKLKCQSKIKSFDKRYNTVQLINGFEMSAKFFGKEKWQIGDTIYYESTPKEQYPLNVKILTDN